MQEPEAEKDITLVDICKELKKIQLQNNNIVTQNNDIKKDLGNLNKEFSTLKEDVKLCQREIDNIVKVNANILNEFQGHKKQQDNIIKSHIEINTSQKLLEEKIKELEQRLNEETVTRN